MVNILSNGGLVVQQKDLVACQYIEYYALCVKQYCKETVNRDSRLYDLRGVVISNMANDLKDFVKQFLSKKDKKFSNRNNVSISMISNIVEALEIFGGLYNSGSCKKWAGALKEEYSGVFAYSNIVNIFIQTIIDNGFVVTKCESSSTSSIYLDIDYGSLLSVRISDHYSEDFKGIQVIYNKEKHEKAGTENIYSIREDYKDHDMKKVLSFVLQSLKYQKNKLARKKYEEFISKSKNEYMKENSQYKVV